MDAVGHVSTEESGEDTHLEEHADAGDGCDQAGDDSQFGIGTLLDAAAADECSDTADDSEGTTDECHGLELLHGHADATHARGGIDHHLPDLVVHSYRGYHVHEGEHQDSGGV